MTNLRALRQLTLNRVRVMWREPEVLFWVFGFPILLVVGIGIAFNNPLSDEVHLAVEAGSAAEAYLPSLRRLADVEVSELEPEAATRALARGDVAVVIADGSESEGSVVLRFDPTRPDSRLGRVIAEAALQEAAGGTRPLTIDRQEMRIPGQRYIDWLLPGLLGFNLMGTGLWSVGFYTTQARENGELRRLIATPMRRSDFLFSQIFARFVFLAAEIPVIVFFAWLVFGVPIVGSPLSLAVLVLLGATCFTGLGLLAASRARTTEGVSGIINVIMMPMLVLSGVFFSGERFPAAVQPLIRALPLTALNDAMRAVYNNGSPLMDARGAILVVVLWTAASFIVALRLFRWQ